MCYLLSRDRRHTRVLTAIEQGDPQADKLFPLVYLEEAGEVIGIPARTVDNYWAHGWLLTS